MLSNSLKWLKKTQNINRSQTKKKLLGLKQVYKYICGFPQKLSPAGRSSGPQVCEGTLWESKQHFASGLVWTDEAHTFLCLRLKVEC